MAEATVALTPSDTGYAGQGVWSSNPNLKKLAAGVQQTDANSVLTDVGNLQPRNGLTLSIFYFSAVADTNTWTSEIKNAVACAWQADVADDDDVRASISSHTASGARGRGGAVFTFVAGGTRSGWLWVLHGS